MLVLDSRFLVYILSLFLFSSALISCDGDEICERGDGEMITDTLDLSNFTGIDLRMSANVILTQSSDYSVIVSIQEDLRPLLETQITDNNLTLDLSKCVWQHEPITFYISMPALHYARIAGSGDIQGTNYFGDNHPVSLQISGSGDISLNIDALQLDTKISGSGDMNLTSNTTTMTHEILGSGTLVLAGSAETFQADIKGSGDIHAFNCITQFATIDVTGSGNCEIYAEQALTATVSGSGDIFYRGYPSINTSISGSGNIQDAN